MSEIKIISPKQAAQLLESNPQAVLIDVRSTMEYMFVGHPKGAVSIPWIDEPHWKVDPEFTTHVRQLMLGGVACEEDCAPIILICRSGKRSLEAGKKLLEDGFREVYSVDSGFEGPLDGEHHRSSVAGWRFEGLPWEQC